MSPQKDFHLFSFTMPPGFKFFIFPFCLILVFLLLIYSNSFKGTWVFDDIDNILENRNIQVEQLDFESLQKSFYGLRDKISRPVTYLSLALNYYFGKTDVFGYHLVNFIIHYLSAVFLFLFIYKTLHLPLLRDRFAGHAYSITLLAVVLWAVNPVQVTAVTYIVQRMASMAGLFYIMSMYFYLQGRTAERTRKKALSWSLCVLSALLAVGSKENAAMIPFSIWLFDLLLIQGASRDNITKNLKFFIPVALVAGAAALWYVNIGAILSGEAYAHRPFTLAERLLTQPRIVIFYITLLLYPVSSRLMLVHDIEWSTSLLTPWTTLPAIGLIAGLLVLAAFLARRRPLISFCIFFYFLNHVIESSFIPLEMIFEHRNYIPSMFFFVPVAVGVIYVFKYFWNKSTIRFAAAAVFTFVLFSQGHTVFQRNSLFENLLFIWHDNVEKAPRLSRPANDLGEAYWNLGRYDKAYQLFSKAAWLNRQPNKFSIGINFYNLGLFHFHVSKEYDKALKFFHLAREAYPGYQRSYHGEAACLIRQGYMTLGKEKLEKALSYWPGAASLRHSYAFVLLKLGEYDRAILEAREALRLHPEEHTSWCILAEAFRKNGSDRLAAYYWERYLKNHPDDLEGNLALIPLYWRLEREAALLRTIGKIIISVQEKTWAELFEEFEAEKNSFVYVPDADEIISIVKKMIKLNKNQL